MSHPTKAYLEQVAQISARDNENEKSKKLTIKQRRFLASFVQTGTILAAARAANVGRTTHYAWVEKSASYREAFLHAELASREVIMEACRKVAVEDENVPMLIHLRKGAYPEVFGTQRHELSGPDGSPIRVQNETETVDEILDRIHGLMRQQDAAETSTPSPGLPRGRGDEFPDSEDTEG